MTNDCPEILKEREALRLEVQRLAPFEQWVRMHGRHAEFCPAGVPDSDGVTKECTCGLETLRCSKPDN